MVGGLPGDPFVFVELEEGGGVAQIALFAFAALGLEVAKSGKRLLELAREALAVEAEGGKGAMGVDDVEAEGGFFGGWMGGASKKVGFEEWDAVEAPGGVGEFVDELSFRWGGGLVLVEELLDVALEGGEVLGGEDGGAAGEAVLERVERGAEFAGGGAGAGGVLGVGAVYFGAMVGGVVRRRWGGDVGGGVVDGRECRG
jgi:hypothetical protein